MAITKEVARKRQELILKALEVPQTISRLKLTMLDEYEISITDSTMRRDIRELQSFGMIQYTGGLEGREPLYVAATGFNMPSIYNPLLNKSYTPMQLAEGAATHQQILQAQHVNVIERTICDLLNYARLRRESNEFSYQDELNALRSQLQKSNSVLLTYAKMIEQLLAQKVWWSNDSIASVTEDVSFDPARVFEYYGRMLQDG